MNPTQDDLRGQMGGIEVLKVDGDDLRWFHRHNAAPTPATSTAITTAARGPSSWSRPTMTRPGTYAPGGPWWGLCDGRRPRRSSSEYLRGPLREPRRVGARLDRPTLFAHPPFFKDTQKYSPKYGHKQKGGYPNEAPLPPNPSAEDGQVGRCAYCNYQGHCPGDTEPCREECVQHVR